MCRCIMYEIKFRNSNHLPNNFLLVGLPRSYTVLYIIIIHHYYCLNNITCLAVDEMPAKNYYMCKKKKNVRKRYYIIAVELLYNNCMMSVEKNYMLLYMIGILYAMRIERFEV